MLFLIILGLGSCTVDEPYPQYDLYKVKFVPDSLKLEHRQYVLDLIKSASYNMTGGDYESVDETIIQANETADDIFSVSVIGLRKRLNFDYSVNQYLRPSELSSEELLILDSLKNGK